jgi:DNA-3-methyladenine glycosylase
VGGPLTGPSSDEEGRGGAVSPPSGRSRGVPGGRPPGQILPRDFFAEPSLRVAARLLGCVLEHDRPEGRVAVLLTEVEAYEGRADPASHAYRGPTARNAVMFGPPGHAYVYFTYGMHFCVNLVCQPAGTASAVLLRAGRVIEGGPLAAARRAARRAARPPLAAAERELARGPARLCQALGIDRAQDGADVCDPASPLRIRSGPPVPGDDPAPDRLVSRGPRVGVSSAADRDWRFWLAGDPTVSAYRPHVPRSRPKAVSPSAGGDGTMGR